MTGDRLTAALAGRYRIERELGQGGMAVVYLAADLKHQRRVALKVLRPELAAALGPERFLREIATTAALHHPHILPLYDSGEAAGFLYYVMPFVEGESLRDRLTREKQLPLEEALRIAREVADALSYAHSRGVIHRDIKPENVLLESGHAMVADFGIAKAVTAAGGETLTGTGLTVGTPAYMSPEQAAGEKDLDGRSDLYALGCVLYEMLAGQPPFTGPTVESVVHQHLTAEPRGITQLRPAVPAGIAGVLQRALAKNPADRFNPVAQFGDAIAVSQAMGSTAPGAAPAALPGRRRLPRSVILTAGLAVVLAAALWWWRAHPRGGTGAPSVAVLPFVDLSPDRSSQYLGDGMAETLINVLAQVPGLAVAARTSAFSYRDRDVDVRQIGRQLRVGAVLEGSVQRAGDRLRVTAQLIKTADGLHLWSQSFDRDAADIFAVQDEVARAVATALQGRLLTDRASVRPRGATTNTAAYDAYLLGRFHWNKRTASDLVRAAEYFQTAIRADSNYAQAWAGLADSYVLFIPSEYDVPGIHRDSILLLAERSARRAVALDSTLGEAWTSLGEILEYRLRWNDARAAFERGVALSPQYATAHQWYAYDLMIWNRWDDAIREMERARALDPLSMVITISLAAAYDGTERWDDAAAMIDQTEALAPDHMLTHLVGFAHAVLSGDVDRSAHHWSRIIEIQRGDTAAARAAAEALRDPNRRTATLRDIARHAAEPATPTAIVRALYGRDSVIAYLSRLRDDPLRARLNTTIVCVIGSLRGDPRLERALQDLGFPPL